MSSTIKMPCSIAINRSDVSSSTLFSALWFDPKTGIKESSGSIAGGATKTLEAPFSGDAVLFLRRVSVAASRDRQVQQQLERPRDFRYPCG